MSKRTGRGMTESQFTKYFCDRLKKVNALVLVLSGGNNLQQSGLPDRYVCHTRFRGWIEFKKDQYALQEHQRAICEGLSERGDTVIVCRYSHLGMISLRRVGGKNEIVLDVRDIMGGTDPEVGLKLLSSLSAVAQ